ncbi:hypothetical protein K439DRAFT_708865 [Ramaria rubella]|nr:hypothetical protein K439DRAFT_708865 [Ramaria rubella]
MVTLPSISILLALVLSVFSAPAPHPQETLDVSSVPATHTVSSSAIASFASTVLSAASPPATVSAAEPVASVITDIQSFAGPVTFGELTTPSQGGTFDDFIVFPIDEDSAQAPTTEDFRVSPRFFKSNVKRLIPSIFFDHEGFDRFDVSGATKSHGSSKGGQGKADLAPQGAADTVGPGPPTPSDSLTPPGPPSLAATAVAASIPQAAPEAAGGPPAPFGPAKRAARD